MIHDLIQIHIDPTSASCMIKNRF